MSLDGDNALRILQIVVTAAAAVGAVVGAVKFFLKHMDKRVEAKMKEHTETILNRMDATDNKLSIIQNSLEFFEKYFFEPMRLKGNKKEKENNDG